MRRTVGIALLLAAVAALALAADTAGPLTVEDVVRMSVAGRPSEEILHEIRSREVDFDLGPEMLRELRIAGIPEPLIEAMLERRAARQESAPGPVAAAPAGTAATLTVRLRPGSDGDEAPTDPLLLPAVLLDDTLAAEHGFGAPAAERGITDVALFLLCRTPDHVPDHWRGETPLGRDFVLAPRHRLLAFHAGAERVAAAEIGKLQALAARLRGAELPDEFLRLPVPELLTSSVEPDLAHDLVLGIAALVEERWIVLTTAERDGIVVTPAGDEIAAAVWCRGSARGVDLGARFGATTEAP